MTKSEEPYKSNFSSTQPLPDTTISICSSPGLKELFGEYRNNPDGSWWYQRPAIEQAMKNIGCPDILIKKFFAELDKKK